MSDPSSPIVTEESTNQRHELVGIYHANGSISGEIKYFFGKLVGKASCSLCDITHGMMKEKKTFREAIQKMNVSWRTVHLDERSDDLRRFSDGKTPCVVAKLNDGNWSLVLSSEELGKCEKHVDTFVAALTSALKRYR